MRLGHDYSNSRGSARPRHDVGRGRRPLASADDAADDRPARDRHPHRLGRLAQPHRPRARGRGGRSRLPCPIARGRADRCDPRPHEGAHAPRPSDRRCRPAPSPHRWYRSSYGHRPAPATIAAATSLAGNGFDRKISASALNRDLLVPRPAGRFVFGRLIGREDGKLHLLPPGAGGRRGASSPIPPGRRWRSSWCGHSRSRSRLAVRRLPWQGAIDPQVGRLAPLVEHLVYTERVGGSSPSAPTNPFTASPCIAGTPAPSPNPIEWSGSTGSGRPRGGSSGPLGPMFPTGRKRPQPKTIPI